jgi:O-antigen ligase
MKPHPLAQKSEVSVIRTFYQGFDATCLKVLLFLLPFGLATINHFGSSIFFALVFIVIFGLQQKKISARGVWPEYKCLAYGFIFFLAAMLASLINAADLTASMHKLFKLSYVLLIVPLAVYFHGQGYRRILTLGLLYSLPLNLCFAAYSLGYFDRAQGGYSPIIYGDLMALFGAVLMFDALYHFTWQRATLMKLGAAGLYFIATILSGTRGAIFALPFVFFVALLLTNFRMKDKLRVLGVFFLGSLLLLLVFSWAVPAGEFNLLSKILATRDNLYHFLDGTEKNFSIGQRLMMWNIAYEIFQEHPLLGTGLSDFDLELAARINNNETDLAVVYPHAHSIFFSFLAISGGVGVVSLGLAFFVLPGLTVWQRMRAGRGHPFENKLFLVVLASFFLFGVTETWTSRSVLLITYVIFFSVYLAPSENV